MSDVTKFLTVSDKVKNISELMEKVANHPETQEHLLKSEHQVAWLPMDNIVNGHIKVSPEYESLMNEIHEVLNGYMISEKGGHSPVFYEIRNLGYMTETGESDSFGILTAIIYNKDNSFCICYG